MATCVADDHVDNSEMCHIFLSHWDFVRLSLSKLSSNSDNELILPAINKTIVVIKYDDFPIQTPEFMVDKNCSITRNTVNIIFDKKEVKELLLKYQITQVPCMCWTDDLTNLVKIHHLSIPLDADDAESADTQHNATSLFSSANEAYDRFEFDLAIRLFYDCVHKDPTYKSALFNLSGLLHMLDYPTLATHYIERLLLLDSEDMIAHSFLWALTQPSNTRSIGIQVYQHLAQVGDIKAAQKLAALTGKGELASRGDPLYAQRIYDDMGDTFEIKLCNQLGYKGPWDILTLISEVIDTDKNDYSVMGSWRILDLGSGSGLCGNVFQNFVTLQPLLSIGSPLSTAIIPPPSVESNELNDSLRSPLSSLQLTLSDDLSLFRDISGSFMVGVDISIRMAEITLNSGYYTAVSHCELVTALSKFELSDCINGNNNELGLDLVLAADTFIYVGALNSVFEKARKCLKNNGLLSFSVEDLSSSTMRVNKNDSSSTSKLSEGENNTTKADSDSTLLTTNDIMPIVIENGELKGAVPGWGGELLISARFAHSDKYIQVLAELHQFRIISSKVVVLRTEETLPIQGRLYVLKCCL